MRRREFVKLIGANLLLWPNTGGAAQIPVVGVLSAPAPEAVEGFIAALKDALREAGFTEGQNLAFEYRFAAGDYDRLPAMADDLVRRGVTVIVALAPAAAIAAKKATTTIPIVFVLGNDPVGLGLVTSLNHPGGNVTGVTFLVNALAGKRLQLISDVVPNARTFGLLVNPTAPGADLDRRDALRVAEAMGRTLSVVNATNDKELESAFAALVDERVGGLVISPDALFTSRRSDLVRLAAQHALPTIYHLSEAVTAGGLMSYGTSFKNAHRLAGVYIGGILKGEKPNDLPVQQSTKFEFVINVTTAKRLGLTIPSGLLAVADEVIE
jgi:putative tryptophan/tyrosine transport system substrate-binding protein